MEVSFYLVSVLLLSACDCCLFVIWRSVYKQMQLIVYLFSGEWIWRVPLWIRERERWFAVMFDASAVICACNSVGLLL